MKKLLEAAKLVLEWHDENLSDSVDRENAISELRAAYSSVAMVKCLKCNGLGVYINEFSLEVGCDRCNGTGEVKRASDCEHGYNGLCPTCSAMQTPPQIQAVERDAGEGWGPTGNRPIR